MRMAKSIPQLRYLFPMIALLACIWPAKGQAVKDSAPHESPARGDVEKLIQTSGADVSVAFRTLDGTQELFIQGDDPFPSSSAIKFAVMIELYAEAEAGELRLSDTLLVTPSSQNGGQARTPHTNAKDDPA